MIPLFTLLICSQAWAVFPVFDVDRRVSEVFNKKMILDQLVDLGDELDASEKVLNGALAVSKEAGLLQRDVMELREFVDDANYLTDPNLNAGGDISATIQNTTNFVRGSKRIFRKLQSIGSSSEGVAAASGLETNSLLRQMLIQMYSQEAGKKAQAITEKRQEVREAIKERRKLDGFFATIKKKKGLLAFPDVNQKIKDALEAFRQRKGLVIFVVILIFWIRLCFSLLQGRSENYFALLKDSIIFYLLIYFYVDLVKAMIDIPNLLGSAVTSAKEIHNPARYETYEKLVQANQVDWLTIAAHWFEYALYNAVIAFLVGFGGLFIALGTLGRRQGFLMFLVSGFLFMGIWPVVWAAVDSAVGEFPVMDNSLLKNAAQVISSIGKVLLAGFACFRLSQSSSAQHLFGEAGQAKTFGNATIGGAKKMLGPAARAASSARSFMKPKTPATSIDSWGNREAKAGGAFDSKHESGLNRTRKAISSKVQKFLPREPNNKFINESRPGNYDQYKPKTKPEKALAQWNRLQQNLDRVTK